MQLIETKTLGTAAAAIEFTSIPQTFTDLVVLMNLRSARATNQDQVNFRFNGSTTSYSHRQLFGGAAGGSIITGSSSGTQTYIFGGIVPATNNTANTFSSQLLYIPNYAGSTNKSVSVDSVAENNAATHFQLDLVAGLWSNTSAITSLNIFSDGAANWSIGSMVSLYGVLKGSDGIVTTS